MANSVVFPMYRKRFDGKSYYKIISANEFEEIQLIGKKHIFHVIKAEKYPEQLLIKDLMKTGPLYCEIKSEEFEQKKATSI